MRIANCCPGRFASFFPRRGERRASRRRQYLKATMPRIISNTDRTTAPIIKRLPVIGDPSPRMCGLNLTGMCWSPRLGQENSWMQPDDHPIEPLRRFEFRTASVRGRLHRELSALHPGAGLRFGIEVVDGEDTQSHHCPSNTKDLDIPGIDVARHKSTPNQ